jgi:hypothetical protein
MKIRAGDLTTGDVLQLNDWRLHVLAVEQDAAIAVLTAEFEFLLHFARHDVVEVERDRYRRIPAAAESGDG